MNRRQICSNTAASGLESFTFLYKFDELFPSGKTLDGNLRISRKKPKVLLAEHTVVSVSGPEVLFYSIRTIKTFHLQVITHK